MHKLTITAPYSLDRAVNAPEAARYYGLYWVPAGDELRVTDGWTTYDGDWFAWLTFRNHPAIALHLAPHDFGSSDSDGKHVLIIDKNTRALYIATHREAEQFLQSENPNQWADAFKGIPDDELLKAFDAALAQMREEWESRSQKDIMAEVNTRMQAVADANDALRADLDARLRMN